MLNDIEICDVIQKAYEENQNILFCEIDDSKFGNDYKALSDNYYAKDAIAKNILLKTGSDEIGEIYREATKSYTPTHQCVIDIYGDAAYKSHKENIAYLLTRHIFYIYKEPIRIGLLSLRLKEETEIKTDLEIVLETNNGYGGALCSDL